VDSKITKNHKGRQKVHMLVMIQKRHRHLSQTCCHGKVYLRSLLIYRLNMLLVKFDNLEDCKGTTAGNKCDQASVLKASPRRPGARAKLAALLALPA